MRLLIKFVSLQNAKRDVINNYVIQGFIYNKLIGTEFENIHENKGPKFFNFSNIFPVKDFEIDKEYRLIISSLNKKLIEALYRKLKEDREIKLGILEFKIKRIRKFDLKLKFPWVTATPIILRKHKEVYLYNGNNVLKIKLKNLNILKELGFKKKKEKINIKNPQEISIKDLKYLDKSYKIVKIKDIYYDLESKDNIWDFLDDLKLNGLLKYNLYTGYEFNLEDLLFEEIQFRRSLPLKVRLKNRGDIIFVGNLFKKLNIFRKLDSSERKFYKFLMDVGLGSLNSLGFGFINPVKDKNL
ncbi:MAG: CRISPR-associated endoribonuclease Cas6 [Nanopusillaceae archaeon]